MSQTAEGITQLLGRLRAGEEDARQPLVDLLYRELRSLAHGQRLRGPRRETMNTTALVHEAYVRLLGEGPPAVRDREHFFAVAATAMRHILLDYAEKMGAKKRGGALRRTTSFDRAEAGADDRLVELVAVGEALDRLSAVDPRLTTLVELRFFAGLTVPETAEALGVSESTVGREWRKARLVLRRLLAEEEGGGGGAVSDLESS